MPDHNTFKKDKTSGRIIIRKANVGDVKNIMELVNPFAASNLMLPRGPQYLYENIRDFAIAIDPDGAEANQSQDHNGRGRFMGCGSLHVLWRDIAEVRALAIDADYHHMGVGKAIIEFIKQESRELKIKHLYTFTMSPEFFTELGFKEIGGDDLPQKLWGECSRCPKYFNCDEIGMLYEL
ncbi:MAG: GNAT family N-acetyltransferase [Deltaproteobacteria bacterium]|nr:MAG: GNAT family N-acetyltransferase [Deltaproteobacteria bacterium]